MVSVARRWFLLAKEHLEEAAAAGEKRKRTAYSRAYYAAYNASKAVRYIVNGEVSLKGDDHAKASELPNDFPDVTKWPGQIASLYEHRLRADYDNWTGTEAENSLTVNTCIQYAADFVTECQAYIAEKFSVSL
jgi:sulfur relay (sulfurtransferase) DsrC/TusE family protein